ncbi:MAG TPA: MMPL family transporter [Hyphomicrobiaceae bacterium]|nr:MMPL family transporter [Hyphomicrobiaceae bacterium]
MDGPRRTFAFTFGLERLGLLALRAPLLSVLLILVLSALAVLGVMRLKVDDSLSELFRTRTPEFARYEEIDKRFPSSEFDVLVVVEGKGLLERKGLEAFARMTTELTIADGANGVVSMLSARAKPDEKGFSAQIITDPLPEGAAFDEAVKSLRSNDIVAGKFLSADGQLALAVISLEREEIEKRGAREIIGNLDRLVAKELAGSGLTAKLTGAPVMQLEIRNAVERDRLVYNGLGFLFGALLAFLYFRRVSLTLIAVLGPSIAILWTLGVIGGLDYRLNLFINVLTPLILVSGFSDSMHLVFAIRRDIAVGIDRLAAARNAILDVAPACLLTAMNAALALVSFSWADSALIRTFGFAALLAVAISYIAVAVVVPTLAALLIRPEPAIATAVDAEQGTDNGVLARLTRGLAAMVLRAPMVFAFIGIAAVIATGLAYVRLEPHYRLADQVPDKEQALAATGKLDQKLTGANPVHIMIQWKGGQGLYDPATLKTIGEAHNVLEKAAGLGNVWSLESLRRWLREAGDDRIETVKSYVKILPSHLQRRFIAKEENAVLVTGRLPDIDASKILPIIDAIDAALTPVRKANPGYDISVTGLPAIAAKSSAKLIGELNWGLVGDMFVIFIFLGIALRSALSGVASILPSLFPIFATGAILYATGEGLQFASIIAITVAFALAIDSTIHFLNRFQLEEMREGADQGYHAALMRTVTHIGPAVVLTTLVLALGLGVTMLSHLPSLRLFGRLAAVCLLASLIGQLIILPATIAVLRRWWPAKAAAR